MKDNSEILKHKLTEIREILLELECLKQDIRSIHNPGEEYFDRMIKKSRFFYRLYLNYTKLFVIDCHKLIDKIAKIVTGFEGQHTTSVIANSGFLSKKCNLENQEMED